MPSSPMPPPDTLRRLLQETGAQPGATQAHPHMPLGIPEIDAHLAGGLPLGVLHELTATGIEAELATLQAAFAAHLIARMSQQAAQEPGTILWVSPQPDLYALGLIRYGIDPSRLLLVEARDNTEALQVMETALRTGGVDAVVGEISDLGRIEGRRLHFACQTNGITAFALRRWPHGRSLTRKPSTEGTAAATRWRIAHAPSESPIPRLPGPPRWRLDLLHARAGRPGAWITEVTDAPNPLRLVTRLPGEPAGGQPAAPLPLSATG